MILAIDDQMVPYSILKLCMEVYVPKEARADKDPLLSPVYASDEVHFLEKKGGILLIL